MSDVDELGFNDRYTKQLVKVRRLIDGVLRPMGLDESLRLNPAFEHQLNLALKDVDFSKIDITARPLVIAGKKFEIDNGNLIIEEKIQEDIIKKFETTTYEKRADSKGMVKSYSSISYQQSADRSVFTEGRSDQFKYFTDTGVEMSRIDLVHEGVTIEDGNFYRQEPEMSERFKKTNCVLDAKNNVLVIPELPADYSSYVQVDRHSHFIEQALVKAQKRTYAGEMVFDGATNIDLQNGIASLIINSQALQDFCSTKNLTTGEKFPPRSPEDYMQKIDVTAAIIGNGEVVSPLYATKTLPALADMSNGRANKGLYTARDYEEISRNCTLDSIKVGAQVIKIMKESNPYREDKSKTGEDR